MDSLIKRFDSELDLDLRLCTKRGIAYQADMKLGRVSYDAQYTKKVEAYEGGSIAQAVLAGRCDMLRKHLPGWSTVLDVGAGTGAFVKAARQAGYNAKGFDVLPKTVGKLKAEGLFAEDPHKFDAVTLWDTLEHLEDPHLTLRSVRKGALLFVSIPLFESLQLIRNSKHYRPGEHLYYFTRDGFVGWMELHGFRKLEFSGHEMQAGRESIGAFCFVKDLPDYHDHVAAYTEMHAQRYYGSSAVELHLDEIAKVVRRLKPASILDYGCGRSDLIAHFWNDGARKLARYDPAIPKYKTLPEGVYDLAVCCDVMEHIPMASVDLVLTQIRQRANTAVFTISTKLARARLPDGRNAHVTILEKSEWIRWVQSIWGRVEELPSQWPHELVLLASLKA